MTLRSVALAGAAVLTVAFPAAAEVVDKGAGRFTIRIEQRTTAVPAVAYNAMVEGLPVDRTRERAG